MHNFDFVQKSIFVLFIRNLNVIATGNKEVVKTRTSANKTSFARNLGVAQKHLASIIPSNMENNSDSKGGESTNQRYDKSMWGRKLLGTAMIAIPYYSFISILRVLLSF